MAKVEASKRLRLAIASDDLPLVKRLLNNHPECLQNPDFEDKANTSLHLASKLGLDSIAQYLIDLGHDCTSKMSDSTYSQTSVHSGISVNTDGQAPIHLAAAASHGSTVELLCEAFPETVNRQDKQRQTPLHLAARCSSGNPKLQARPADDPSAVDILLANGADVNAQDLTGNTSLHNATAWGNLKAMRALFKAGADASCSNGAGWLPQSYSITLQAEVYYKNLVAEQKKSQKTTSNSTITADRRLKGGGGAVRLVAGDDEENEGTARAQSDGARSNASSEASSAGGLGIASIGSARPAIYR